MAMHLNKSSCSLPRLLLFLDENWNLLKSFLIMILYIYLMQSAKENILSVIKNLPHDATYDDVMEALYVNHKIDAGIEQLEKGNSLTLDQLRERLKPWLE
jgi:hypothetical protein